MSSLNNRNDGMLMWGPAVSCFSKSWHIPKPVDLLYIMNKMLLKLVWSEKCKLSKRCVLCADPYFSQAGHSWRLGHRWQHHWAECPWKVCGPLPWTPSPAYAALEHHVYSQHLFKPVNLFGLLGKCIVNKIWCCVVVTTSAVSCLIPQNLLQVGGPGFLHLHAGGL